LQNPGPPAHTLRRPCLQSTPFSLLFDVPHLARILLRITTFTFSPL